jgi:ectoine hydroxylase-related dioxygenase (phytanoyl-CoA dioxygenase family)
VSFEYVIKLNSLFFRHYIHSKDILDFISLNFVDIAKQLLNVDENEDVLLYQSSSFWKDPSITNQQTPFHADLRTQPLDCIASEMFITIWCPLETLRKEKDSVLEFASRSHVDQSLPFWHSLDKVDDIEKFILNRYKIDSYEYNIGDCRCENFNVDLLSLEISMNIFDSVHSGWLFHRARKTNKKRRAITFSFVASNTRRRLENRKTRPIPSEV